LVSEDHGFATLWDAHTGSKLRSFKPAKDFYYGPDAQFLPNRNYLLGSYGDAAIIWDIKTGRIVQRFEYGNDAQYFPSEISPDGKYILTPYQDTPDYLVALWDVQTGKLIHTLDGQETDFSPNGN
jgi:WD40 repeat protein